MAIPAMSGRFNEVQDIIINQSPFVISLRLAFLRSDWAKCR